MMKSLEEGLAANRRIAILLALKEASHEANESTVHIVLTTLGVHVSRDQVRTDFSWLKENGLVTLRETYGLQIAKLTQRGIETADGDITTPGVKHPSPES
jgi:hypothetical protein